MSTQSEAKKTKLEKPANYYKSPDDITKDMIRHLLLLTLMLAVLPAVAFAQGGGTPGHVGTPEQQRACRPDVERFCRQVQNQGDYAIADCLKTNERRLSSACRRVMEAGSR
jgi:hypothetical protein